MKIDYRDLLVKYMAEVLLAEGVSFVPYGLSFAGLTKEEVEELKLIESEATLQANKDSYTKIEKPKSDQEELETETWTLENGTVLRRERPFNYIGSIRIVGENRFFINGEQVLMWKLLYGHDEKIPIAYEHIPFIKEKPLNNT